MRTLEWQGEDGQGEERDRGRAYAKHVLNVLPKDLHVRFEGAHLLLKHLQVQKWRGR